MHMLVDVWEGENIQWKIYISVSLKRTNTIIISFSFVKMHCKVCLLCSTFDKSGYLYIEKCWSKSDCINRVMIVRGCMRERKRDFLLLEESTKVRIMPKVLHAQFCVVKVTDKNGLVIRCIERKHMSHFLQCCLID